MEKDLQSCIDFGCKKFWLYHYKTTEKGKWGRHLLQILKKLH